MSAAIKQQGNRQSISQSRAGPEIEMLKPPPGNDDGYCAGNSVGAAAFVTGGGFHLPVSASLW
jgi:hypothetical protein